MKKALILFAGALMLCQNTALALTVKKAAPVATKESAATDTTASLVPTVLGLVSGIQAMNAKQNAMTAECIPTNQEINFVNETVKEWAKTGTMSASEVERSLGMRPCQPGQSYARTLELAAGESDMRDLICYDTFTGSGNDDMIWAGYPMAAKAVYCSDGSYGASCSTKNQKTASNIYNIFALIDFSVADYTVNEAKMAATLLSKIENCSDAKLSAKKRAMWGEFLTTTIGNMGQSTNTGAIMQQVGSLSNSGLSGAMQSIGGIATQFMDK